MKVFISVARDRAGELHPEVGLFVDPTEAAAKKRVKVLNDPASWLREAGYKASYLGEANVAA